MVSIEYVKSDISRITNLLNLALTKFREQEDNDSKNMIVCAAMDCLIMLKQNIIEQENEVTVA